MTLAAPPAEPVTLTVISIVITAAGAAATIASMTGGNGETMVEVPRWVCSKRRWDNTIVGWSRKWYQLGIYPVYRGWVCTEVQCLNTLVPESLVPNIQQCTTLGQRVGI